MTENRLYPLRPIRAIFLLAFATVVGALAAQAQGQGARPVVYLVPIEGMIDLGLAPFVQRVLDEATDAGAAAVILEINTFGGRVDARRADPRRAARARRVRTVAFVNKRAISAGALISLAADDHRHGGRRHDRSRHAGARWASPGAPAQPVAEKTVSYVRKEFRATAESRGRPPLVRRGHGGRRRGDPRGRSPRASSSRSRPRRRSSTSSRTSAPTPSRPCSSGWAWPGRRSGAPRRPGPRRSCAS